MNTTILHVATGDMRKMAELMQAMGAEKWEGFNPVAPRAHRWMMDFQHPETTRVQGWALWRTVDRDPDGKMGPPKTTRTNRAHDSRVKRNGFLEVKHLAEDLGMSVANATDALRRAVEMGLVSTDDDGRIWPNFAAPLPRRIRGEDDPEGEDGKQPIFFCTKDCPSRFSLLFNNMQNERRTEWTRRYRAMERGFAERLEQMDPEPRAFHTWCYLEAEEYAEQTEADAIAAARALRRRMRAEVYAQAGYQPNETRGRKTREEQNGDNELTVQLSVRETPEEFSVRKSGPNSVQMRFSDLYRAENGNVQKAHPYFLFQRYSENLNQGEACLPHGGKVATEQDKEAPAAQHPDSEKEAPNGASRSTAPPSLKGDAVPPNNPDSQRRRGALGLGIETPPANPEERREWLRQQAAKVKAAKNGRGAGGGA